MARKPVVIITGASKGLGLAVTKILLAEFGADVVAFSRSESKELVELRRSHGDSLLVIKGDVTDATAVHHAMESALNTYGHIDGLVLNAGVLAPLGRIAADDIPLDAWQSHFNVNLFSLITAIRATLPALRKSELGGRIVFVSSGSAVKGTPTMGPYNASKAAMNSLCRTLAEEEPEVISVAMRPGTVDTQMQTQLRSDAALTDKVRQSFSDLYIGRRLLKPEDPGYVIASLALKTPKSLSGQFISWDADVCANFRRPT
ncbi:NAD(P)-binding protein [Laetiporus sulphureus 93-53]|uniref:NAD(P)-binding protein n=1 Tax=Laetiporus sulphureus 93-53 TaxID=1314785 RepID=A0A165I1Z9_9APHY|nr:NAD(P)-binding protein [Laetiporus sulphureus 93-53]KZT12488.1 NAD(P)-binding protein [Laetiporus sulphureus 93-53]